MRPSHDEETSEGETKEDPGTCIVGVDEELNVSNHDKGSTSNKLRENMKRERKTFESRKAVTLHNV